MAKRVWFVAPTVVAVLMALAVDRITKIWAVRTLPFQTPVVAIPGLERIFDFVYIHNTGAAFGMLPQAGLLFAVVSIAVEIGLIIWYDRLPVQHFLVRFAIGLIMGGAAGNLVDRLRTGYVVDFLHLTHWPIFNAGDSAIVCGVVILAIYLTFVDEQARKRDAGSAADSDGGLADGSGGKALSTHVSPGRAPVHEERSG